MRTASTFAALAAALGDDVRDKNLAPSSPAGPRAAAIPEQSVLTGNAGTGKTAVAEAVLPGGRRGASVTHDVLAEVGAQAFRRVLKGSCPACPTAASRVDCQAASRTRASDTPGAGVCRSTKAYCGMPSTSHRRRHTLPSTLESALRRGAARNDTLTRDRERQPPAPHRCNNSGTQLVDYVSRTELWAGCSGCARTTLGGCPMRTNAEQLPSTRRPGTAPHVVPARYRRGRTQPCGRFLRSYVLGDRRAATVVDESVKQAATAT